MPTGKPANLVGRTFGYLTVVTKTPFRYKGGGVLWACRCQHCGNAPVYVATGNLTYGNQVSCGCYGDEQRSKPRTHGLTHSPLYQRYASFIQKHKHEICKRWLGRGGVQRFYDDMGEPPEGAHIQRYDTSKPYSKANCYWGTARDTLRRAKGVKLTYKGEARCISEWAEILGVSRQCVHQGGQRYLERRLSELESL